jgi:hypothetical protein
MHALSRKPPLVILLHGTFAGHPAGDGKPKTWWQEGSPFRSRLAEATGAEVIDFGWGKGGANSETLRREGARDLLDMLHSLEKEGRDYHLVGHSHGGSVIWQALVYAAARRGDGPRTLQRLRSWTTVGTPFQDFVPAHVELVGAVIAAVLVLIWLAICVGAWGTLALDGDSARTVLRHAVPWQFESLSVLASRAMALDPGEIFFRLILAAFVASAAVALALTVLGLLQPLSYVTTGRAAPAPPDPPTVPVTTAAIIGWLFLSVFLFLVAGEAIKALALALATVGSLALCVGATWFSWTTGLGWWRAQQRQAERDAADAYGDRWLPIYHPDDEAIAALRCALLPAPSIVPRPRAYADHRPTRLILAPIEVLRLLADQFVWETAMTGVQGDDLPGAHVRSSGVAPRVLTKRCERVERLLGNAVSDAANRKGADLLCQLRQWLAAAYVNRDIDAAVHELAHRLSFDAVIHTSYFTEEGPGNDPPRLARAEVLDCVAARILDPDVKHEHPPLREGVYEPNASRQQRHMLLHWSRVIMADIGCLAVFTTCLVGYMTLVRPLRTEMQVRFITEHPSRQGALATSDSPVVGAFLARLAASDPASDVARTAAEALVEPNARAVAAQRLAFIAGFAGQPQQFGGSRTALSRRAAPDQESERRMEALARLSWMAGRVAAGRSVSKDDAIDAATRWNQLDCAETDLDAAARMTAQIAVAASLPDIALTVAAKAAAARNGSCGKGEQDGTAPWIRAFLTDTGYDVLTWDEAPDQPPDQQAQRRHTAMNLLALARDGTDGAAGALARDAETAETSCASAMTKLADLLHAAPVPRGCTAVQTAVEEIGSAIGNAQYIRVVDKLLPRHASTLAKSCRGTGFDAAGTLEQQMHAAENACRVSSSARRRVAKAAAIQLAVTGEALADDPLVHTVQQMARNLPHTVDTAGDGVLWPVIDVYYREAENKRSAGPALATLATDIALAQERLAAECDPASTCTGKIRLEHLWTAVEMLKRVGHKGRGADLVTRASGEQGPMECTLVAGDREATGAWLQLAKAAQLAGLPDIQDRFTEQLLCAPAEARCPAAIVEWTPDQLLTLADLTARHPDRLSRVRACLDYRIQNETSATDRAWAIQRLANTYLLDGDLYGARTAAIGAGAVNYVLAGLCPILEGRIRKPGDDRIREGNWPQPVPVTFRTRSRFTYDNDQPQPLQCRGWRTFDLK